MAAQDTGRRRFAQKFIALRNAGGPEGTDGRRRSPDQGPQVDFSHDAVLDQERVGRMVDLQHPGRHVLVDGVLAQQPCRLRQTCQRPLLDQVLRNHFRAEQVLFAQFGQALQALDAQAQVIELPARKIKQPQGQARGKNAVFDGLVADQFHFSKVRQGRARGLGGRGGWLAHGAHDSLDPGRAAVLVEPQGVAQILHFPRISRPQRQFRQRVANRPGKFGQHLHHALGEQGASLSGKKTLRRIAGRHGGRLSVVDSG